MKKRINQLNALKHLYFWYGATVVIVGPFLPLYFYHKGFSIIEIGIFLGVSPFVGILSQPLWAYLSDRFQSVKKILMILFLLTGTASIGVFFGESFSSVLLFTILLYFSWSPTGPLLDSLAISSIQGKSQTYGGIRLFASTGFAVFALLFGSVMRVIGIQYLYLVYWLMLMILLVSLVWIKDIVQLQKKVELRDFKALFQNRYLLWFLLLILLISIPNGFNGAMFGLHLQNLGAKEDLIGLASTVAAASEVPIFYYLTRYLHKFKEMLVLCIVAGLFTFRWAITALISSPLLLTGFQVTQSVTFAVFWMVALQTMVKIVPDYLRSTGQAILASITFGLCSIFGSVIGAFIFQHYGGKTMYLTMAFITMMASLLFYITYRSQVIKDIQLKKTQELQK